MTSNPFGPAGRTHRRRRKLGPDARCLFCGEDDVTVLLRVRVRRSVLEEHHVVGRAHDPYVVVTLCLNHHARVSARQRDDGVPLQATTNVLEWLIAILEGLASFSGVLGEQLRVWCAMARALIAGLDQDYPGWRNHPWARR